MKRWKCFNKRSVKIITFLELKIPTTLLVQRNTSAAPVFLFPPTVISIQARGRVWNSIQIFPGSTPFYWLVSVKFVWLTTPFPETSSALGIDSSHSYSAVPTNAWAPTFSVWEQSPWLPFQILIVLQARTIFEDVQEEKLGISELARSNDPSPS